MSKEFIECQPYSYSDYVKLSKQFKGEKVNYKEFQEQVDKMIKEKKLSSPLYMKATNQLDKQTDAPIQKFMQFVQGNKVGINPIFELPYQIHKDKKDIERLLLFPVIQQYHEKSSDSVVSYDKFL